MSDEVLPTFRYHPDPLATGAFERLARACRCCGLERGWSYVHGTAGAVDLHDSVCPWCIADGSAAERFEVVFTDLGNGVPTELVGPHIAAVVDEIERRTPGFSGWQAERWLFHCGDAAAFLGPVGWEDLEDHPDAVAALREEVSGWGLDADDVDAVVGSLDVDGAATAYLFRCLHCGAHLAYADME